MFQHLNLFVCCWPPPSRANQHHQLLLYDAQGLFASRSQRAFLSSTKSGTSIGNSRSSDDSTTGSWGHLKAWPLLRLEASIAVLLSSTVGGCGRIIPHGFSTWHLWFLVAYTLDCKHKIPQRTRWRMHHFLHSKPRKSYGVTYSHSPIQIHGEGNNSISWWKSNYLALK